jgi:hypothetical protein
MSAASSNLGRIEHGTAVFLFSLQRRNELVARFLLFSVEEKSPITPSNGLKQLEHSRQSSAGHRSIIRPNQDGGGMGKGGKGNLLVLAYLFLLLNLPTATACRVS